MKITLKTLRQERKFNKEESIDFINEMVNLNILTTDVSAYLTGYNYSKVDLNQSEIDKILSERERKYNKELKYSKKKSLPEPLMYSMEVERTKIELTPAEHDRSHKENFYPELEGLVLLLDLKDTVNNKELLILINDLIIDYKNTEILFDYFFIKWAKLLNSVPCLKTMKTKNEWFVMCLEDKLTLGAAMNKKVKWNLGEYKNLFLDNLK